MALAPDDTDLQSLAALAASQSAPDGGSDYLTQLAQSESGGDPSAKNPNSTAAGPYQFTDPTWSYVVGKYGPDAGVSLEQRNDPTASGKMAAAYARENAAALRPLLGRELNPTDLALAHFLGAGGAEALLTADPQAPATSAVSDAALKANQNVFLNQDGSPKSIAQVYADFGNKVGGATAMPGAASPVAAKAPTMPGIANLFPSAESVFGPQKNALQS
jgi:hypothetical protein